MTARVTLPADKKLPAEAIERIFAGLPDLLVVTDEAGCIGSCNFALAGMFGYEAADIAGLPVTSLFAEPHRQAVRDMLAIPEPGERARQLRTGRRITGLHRDGGLFPVSINVAECQGPEGRSFVFVVRDITNILNTERELERSNQELQQFAAVASHDLQAPLRTVTTFASSLLQGRGAELDAESRHKLSRIISACGRMRELTDSLLELARISQGSPEFSTVALDEIFDQLLQDLGASIEESGATISRESLPVVLGNRAQIRQALQNLLTNAIKFRRPGTAPLIRVAAARQGSAWKISVTDNGIGIDPAHHGRIFGLFQRLHGRSQFAGSGIGLAMVRKIAKRHGGEAGLSSVPGQGSCFWITLPAAG